MTTNVQLERSLRDVKDFVGVFPSNELPARLSVRHERPFSLIVNYDRRGMPGSHWVGMRFPAKGPSEYFDSFGLQPDEADAIVDVGTHFERYLRKHSDTGTYVRNTFDFQCLQDDTCGEWAALFIEHGLPQDNPGYWRPIMSASSCARRDLKAREDAKVLPPSERKLAPGLKTPLTKAALASLLDEAHARGR